MSIVGFIFFSNSSKCLFFYAGQINFWFALFNLPPIPPLDGSKIITWKPLLGAAAIAISTILVFMPQIVFGLV